MDSVVDEKRVAPANAQERIDSLDFIRGLAVMFILAANIVAFGQPFSAYMYPTSFLTEHGDTSNWLWVGQFVLVDGKMRGLFTLLFGAGLYLFMERAWARGATRALQARRLGFLLLFGLFHFYFIWRGDILSYYAMVGLVVLACLNWSRKAQLITGVVGYVFGALFYMSLTGFLYLVADTPLGDSAVMAEARANGQVAIEKALADDAIVTVIKQSGDYAGFVAHQFSQHGFEPFANALFFAFETLPLMLIGVALYRYGFFNGQLDRRKMRIWGWVGVLVGGGITLLIALWTKGGGLTYYGTLAAFVGFSGLPRILIVIGIAALLVQYVPNAGHWLGDRIKAAGRAAFSNYLGTSIVMLFVFHGFGLGLFGELTRPQLYIVVVLAWLLMLAWSKPWLDRYKYGPLEWLWRCLTYGRLFALKR